jgi:hypothetical protein
MPNARSLTQSAYQPGYHLDYPLKLVGGRTFTQVSRRSRGRQRPDSSMFRQVRAGG